MFSLCSYVFLLVFKILLYLIHQRIASIIRNIYFCINNFVVTLKTEILQNEDIGYD